MLVGTRQYRSFNEALAQVAIELASFGDEVDVCNAVGDRVITKELMDYHMSFAADYNNICTLEARKFPFKGAQAEFLWYMTAKPDANIVAKYLPNWLNFSDDAGNVHSNYGVYWRQYVPGIIDELKRDKMSRRAVMNVYNSGDAPFGKDTPCTLTLQFMIRNNRLHMIVNMRSNDIWYGLSIDQFCNSLLHQLVLHSLQETYPDLKLGQYHHNAGSMHVYMSSSKGNATISMQTLFDMYDAFTSKPEHGARFDIPANVTFDNFWQAIDNESNPFDRTRFEHFKAFK